MTSTHGAWRHAEAQFLLAGDLLLFIAPVHHLGGGVMEAGTRALAGKQHIGIVMQRASPSKNAFFFVGARGPKRHQIEVNLTPKQRPTKHQIEVEKTPKYRSEKPREVEQKHHLEANHKTTPIIKREE